MNASLHGFRKAAAAGVLANAGKAITSIGKQIAAGGVRAGRGAAGTPVGGWARGGAMAAESTVEGAASVTRQLVNKGTEKVRGRMMRRGLWGAGIGAGGSMLQQKMRGEDVDLGRAAMGGVMGGAIGAAAGTTVGARSLRRLTAPKTTPNMSFGDAVNPAKWLKRSPNVMTGAAGSKNFAPGSVATKGHTAFGNMSPLDKGFLGLNAYQGAKAMTDPEQRGHRGETIGGLAGMSGAMLTGSRWGGLRSGSGAMKSIGKSLGLYMGADFAGRQIGKRFDKPEGAPGVPQA